MSDSGAPVSALEQAQAAVAPQVVALDQVATLAPASTKELSERAAIVASARAATKRGRNMRGLVQQMAKAQTVNALQQPAEYKASPGVVGKPRRFFEALARLGDVGRAAAIVSLHAKSGTLWRWRKVYRGDWDAAVRAGAEAAERNRPLEWVEVEGILAEIVRNSRHREQLKAIELWARLDGRLDTKVQVDITRAQLESKLQEALMTIAAQQAPRVIDVPASDNAHSLSSANSPKSE